MPKQEPEVNLHLLTEDVLTMREAAREFPRDKHVSCLYRWAHRGVDGHRLETLKLGSQLVTSRQALTRFLTAINTSAK